MGSYTDKLYGSVKKHFPK